MSFDDPAWRQQERAWLAAWRQGDGRAFDKLFAVYAPPLYRRVLLPRLGDPTIAEDALAETFRKVFESLDGYRDEDKGLWPYLATIATNQAHDVHRQRARRGRLLASFAALVEVLPATEGADGAGDAAALRGAIDRVLGAINPRYRRAIELRFLEERGREECARIMEVKLGTFDVLLLRALRAFRQQWQELVGER